MQSSTNSTVNRSTHDSSRSKSNTPALRVIPLGGLHEIGKNTCVFEYIRILNPKLDRKIRQKDMSRWLMPFGFIAGIAFSNMTNLSTFSFLGLNNIGESLIGGLLGMGSGYLGSIVSSASININRNKELRSIINLNKEGKWLVLLENQIGAELPWALIKQSGAKDIIFLEG